MMRKRVAAAVISALFATDLAADEAGCDFDAAMDSFRQKQWSAASDGFGACTAGESAGISTFYLGIATRHEGDIESAQALLSRAVELMPDFANACLELGATLEAKKQWPAARAQYQQCLVRHEGNVPAQLNIARIDHWQGDINASIERYEQIKQTEPDNIGFQLGYGFALIAARRLDDARRQFTQVLRHSPDDASALKGLSMLDEIRNVTFSIEAGHVASNRGNSTNYAQAKVTKIQNHRLSWGADLRISDASDASNDAQVIQPNTPVRQHSLAAHLRTQLRPNTAFRVEYGLEESNLGERREHLKFDLSQRLQNKASWFAGTKPTFNSEGKDSQLSYLGYAKQITENSGITSQLFYATQRGFADSKALSLSWDHQTSRRNRWRAGINVGRTADQTNHGLTIETTQRLGGRFYLNAGASYGSLNDTTQYHTAIRYTF